MAPPGGVKPSVISTGTAPMAPIGGSPIDGQPVAGGVPTLPTTPVTSGGRTPWVMGALWRTMILPTLCAAGALFSSEAKAPKVVPAMTDAEATVWQLPKPLRDVELGIDRTAVPSQLRTQWNELLRTDFASPPSLREKIAAVFRHFDSPHAALALNVILYNRAAQAGWSATEQDQFIDIIHSETVAVFERFNAAADQVGREKAAKRIARQDTTLEAGSPTSTGRPLREAVTIPKGSKLPRTSTLTLSGEDTYTLATSCGRARGDLLLAMMAERDPLAVLFEDYLTWAEEAGAAKAVIAQARVDYMQLFQVVFPGLENLDDGLDIDESRIGQRLAAMYNEFRPEPSRDFWQAFTDQLQFWRMVSDPLQGRPDHDGTGHFIVFLLLMNGAFTFGGAYRHSRLEAPVRMRLDLAQRLMSEAQERVIHASSRVRQIEAACSAHGGGDAQQGQHQFSQGEIAEAMRELHVAAAELADRRQESEDAAALLAGDDPKRQRFARRLWRAVQRAPGRTGEFARYQLPWGLAFAVATALILAPIQVEVASNGDPIPLLDPPSRMSWRVK